MVPATMAASSAMVRMDLLSRDRVRQLRIPSCTRAIREPDAPGEDDTNSVMTYPQSGMRMMSSKPVISLLRTCIRAEKLRPAFWLATMAPTRSSL